MEKPTTRVYEVHYKTWNIAMSVVDPSTSQQIYTLTSDGALGTSTSVINTLTNQPIGHGTTSHCSSGVQIDMLNGGTFTTKTSKAMGMGSPQYTSPAFGGKRMTMKNKAMSTKINYTLIDEETGMALAKFESAGMKWGKKVGRLEIAEETSLTGGQLDEVVVVMLTLMYRKLVAGNMAAVVN